MRDSTAILRAGDHAGELAPPVARVGHVGHSDPSLRGISGHGCTTPALAPRLLPLRAELFLREEALR